MLAEEAVASFVGRGGIGHHQRRFHLLEEAAALFIGGCSNCSPQKMQCLQLLEEARDLVIGGGSGFISCCRRRLHILPEAALVVGG